MPLIDWTTVPQLMDVRGVLTMDTDAFSQYRPDPSVHRLDVLEQTEALGLAAVSLALGQATRATRCEVYAVGDVRRLQFLTLNSLQCNLVLLCGLCHMITFRPSPRQSAGSLPLVR